MNDERMPIAVGELKEFVRNKVASLRTEYEALLRELLAVIDRHTFKMK